MKLCEQKEGSERGREERRRGKSGSKMHWGSIGRREKRSV